MPAKNNAAVYRPDLGQAVMEYVEGATMQYIGLQVMPVFRTAKASSSYPVIPKEALLKLAKVERAPRGVYHRDDFEWERGYFSTTEKGTEEPIDDTERELFDEEAQGMADMIAVKRAMDRVLRAQEKRIADLLFNTTNFSANTITHEWDDASNCVPIDDVNDGMVSFRAACGMLPDALIISYSTFLDLKNCDQIVDRLKYTFPGIDINTMDARQLAAVFGIPRVLVGGGVYDSAGKGITASVTNLWSNEYAMLVKIAQSPDFREPCVGRTFLWTADSPTNPIVEEYREEKIRSDIYRVRHHCSESLLKSYDDSGTAVSNISAACAYLMDNVTT